MKKSQAVCFLKKIGMGLIDAVMMLLFGGVILAIILGSLVGVGWVLVNLGVPPANGDSPYLSTGGLAFMAAVFVGIVGCLTVEFIRWLIRCWEECE